MSVSRMCGVLANYKIEFDNFKQNFPPDKIPELKFGNGINEINILNEYIWCFCVSLWRSGIFQQNNHSFNDSFNLDPETIEKLSGTVSELSNCLSITHSLPFCSLAREYLDENKVP